MPYPGWEAGALPKFQIMTKILYEIQGPSFWLPLWVLFIKSKKQAILYMPKGCSGFAPGDVFPCFYRVLCPQGLSCIALSRLITRYLFEPA